MEARLTDVLPELQPGDKYMCHIEGMGAENEWEHHLPFICETPYVAGKETLATFQFKIHIALLIYSSVDDFCSDIKVK